MFCQPRLLIDHPVRRPKISVILLDWGVRESFHALHYLNNQTVPRDDYELIWLEFYNREPAALWDMVRKSGRGRPGLDRWLVLGYPDDLVYHKHRLYNLGLLAARGDVCIICDSDAVFVPGFIERIIREFEQTPHGIIHLDEVRSLSRDYYPFNYPEIDDITRTSNNWMGMSTKGMLTKEDRLHNANMGACLAARRQDLLAIGGADEHIDYLGYMCGPYEMTFRLVNYHGLAERWLFDEFLYHTWHPNTTGGNEDYHGPHDGRSMSLLALHARATRRVRPFQSSPLFHWSWGIRRPTLSRVLDYLAARAEPSWRCSHLPAASERVYWGLRDKFGYNLFCHADTWFALPTTDGWYCPRRRQKGGYGEVLESNDFWQLERLVEERAAEKPEKHRGSWRRFWDRLRKEQIDTWPARIWRKLRRAASRLRRQQAPWVEANKSAGGLCQRA